MSLRDSGKEKPKNLVSNELTQGRRQGRVPGVLNPLLGYENEYYLKRKNVSEPPFRN